MGKSNLRGKVFSKKRSPAGKGESMRKGGFFAQDIKRRGKVGGGGKKGDGRIRNMLDFKEPRPKKEATP